MYFRYNELIERFSGALGTPKAMIEETFSKPDATDVAMDKYVSVKDYGDFLILVIFETEGSNVDFLRAYRVYYGMVGVGKDALLRMKPLDILAVFMEKYGIAKDIPGYGERKVFVNKPMNVFFPGILDIERYLDDKDMTQRGPAAR